MPDKENKLGPCCICEKTGPMVRNILVLGIKGPTPGRGWGCAVCDLPNDGAAATLCDDCLDAYLNDEATLKYICTGYLATDGRTRLEGFKKIKHVHDDRFHPEKDEDS